MWEESVERYWVFRNFDGDADVGGCSFLNRFDEFTLRFQCEQVLEPTTNINNTTLFKDAIVIYYYT